MKRRISTVEEADAAMERLGWLKAQGHPNAAIRELWECAVTYRAAVHQQGQEPKGKWVKKVGA